jgi:hypothetical protein
LKPTIPQQALGNILVDSFRMNLRFNKKKEPALAKSAGIAGIQQIEGS